MLDNADVLGWRVDDVVSLIRGNKGSTVVLDMLPADGALDAGPKRVALVRDTITLEKQAASKSVIDVRNSGTPRRIASDELSARPGHYATDQFHNPYIVPDHRDRLGREIWEQTEGRVTAFCHGMGTASSLMGVSEALRPHGVFIQAHEPAGSPAISGGGRGSFLIQGWTGFVMPHWDASRVDHVEPIGDADAIDMTRRLAQEDGIFAGISTGANVVGAHRLAERLGPDSVIVSIAVDTGFKYMSVAPYAQ